MGCAVPARDSANGAAKVPKEMHMLLHRKHLAPLVVADRCAWWIPLIAAIALALWPSQINADPQQKGDYAFWPEMPEAAQVMKDVQGKDEADTAARRLAAYRLLYALVWANGDRTGQLPWPPREQALARDYGVLVYTRLRPNEETLRDEQIGAQSYHFQADRAF